MTIDVRTALRVAGALLALPLLLAVARFGLGWPPSGHTEPMAAARPVPGAAASRMRTPAPVVVYVTGEVAHAGLVALPQGARVATALARAVPRPQADLVAVNLAARVEDGEKIAVPGKGSSSQRCAAARASAAGGPGRRRGRSTPSPPAQPLSLNASGAKELARVPGIGPRLAQRIVAYRRTYGPFASLDDLLDVNGVTERTLQRITRFVRP